MTQFEGTNEPKYLGKHTNGDKWHEKRKEKSVGILIVPADTPEPEKRNCLHAE
jgi:hypothetical protein